MKKSNLMNIVIAAQRKEETACDIKKVTNPHSLASILVFSFVRNCVLRYVSWEERKELSKAVVPEGVSFPKYYHDLMEVAGYTGGKRYIILNLVKLVRFAHDMEALLDVNLVKENRWVIVLGIAELMSNAKVWMRNIPGQSDGSLILLHDSANENLEINEFAQKKIDGCYEALDKHLKAAAQAQKEEEIRAQVAQLQKERAAKRAREKELEAERQQKKEMKATLKACGISQSQLSSAS